MANLQLPINQDHEVLGSEYCAGYLDALQKWNNGFYCPASDESQDVFCCGTDSHKYCCTKKDQVVQSEVENFTVLVGIIVGASAALLILTLVSCFCCSCCALYKKQQLNSGSFYHLHTTSEHSGVSNMYSLSNAASRSSTPLPLGASGLSQSVVPPGGGILVGGPNHHASQHHLHSSQLLIDNSIDLQNEYDFGILNGRERGDLFLSHSQTLPHNLSHHEGVIGLVDPDIISHHGHSVIYNTLGRSPLSSELQRESIGLQQSGSLVPNKDLIHHQSIRNTEAFTVSSISQDISQVSRQSHQKNHMIFPHSQQQLKQPLLDQQEEKELFHSTKF